MISQFSSTSLEMYNACTVIPSSIPSVKLKQPKAFPIHSEDVLTTQPQGTEQAVPELAPN